MKLRIRGDSLRFRLTQGEVSRLHAGHKVSESVHFSDDADSTLIYSLQPTTHAGQLSAHFANREICIDIPSEMVKLWATSNQVGIESTQPSSAGKLLRIIAEKDFRCLQPRPEEDEQDNFPHPESFTEEARADAAKK